MTTPPMSREMFEAVEGIIHFSDALNYRDDTLSVSLRQWINRAEAILKSAPDISNIKDNPDD